MADTLFTFEFKGGSSFTFKDNTSGNKINKKLEIIFPNGNVLTFSDNLAQQEFPNGGSGFLGSYTSEILSTFNEIGFLGGTLNVNTKQLREDTVYYPEFFKSGDSGVEFNHEYFPSGIYKVTYSYILDAPGGGILPPELLGGQPKVNFSETQYIKMDQAANICLKRKIEWLFKNELEGDTTQKEYDLVKNQILKLIMMMHIADFDFQSEAYQEANLKLKSCDNICATGNLGYLYDSTRP